MKLSEFIISFGFGVLITYIILSLMRGPDMFSFGLNNNNHNYINEKQDNQIDINKSMHEVTR